MQRHLTAAVAALLILGPAAAQTTSPAWLPLQGYLTDDAGAPLSGEHTVTVALYEVDVGGTPLYLESQPVLLDEGWFTVYVGLVEVLPLELFSSGRARYVGITVGADPEMQPRLALGTTPYAAFAERAGDARTVGGLASDAFATSGHGHPFDALSGVPAGLADGDDDTLGGLSCPDGQLARRQGGAWGCGPDRVLTEAEVEGYVADDGYARSADLSAVAVSGAFGDLQGIPPGLSDGDDDTLGGLSCPDGQIAKRQGGAWGCADDSQVDPATLIQNQTAADQAASFRIAGTGAIARELTVGHTGPAEATVDVDGDLQVEQLLHTLRSRNDTCPPGAGCAEGNRCPCDFDPYTQDCGALFQTAYDIQVCWDETDDGTGYYTELVHYDRTGSSEESVLRVHDGRVGVSTGQPRAELDVGGRARIAGDLSVGGDVSTLGAVTAGGNLRVRADARVEGGLIVDGTARVQNLTVQGTSNVPPAGTWCGLVVDGTLIWRCAGKNPQTEGCPTGYQRQMINTLFGDPTAFDYLCTKQ